MESAFLIVAIALLLWSVTLSNVLFWPRLQPAALADSLHYISVLIPARNEATNLPACLDTVLAQGDIVKEILVYDDHSTRIPERVHNCQRH